MCDNNKNLYSINNPGLYQAPTNSLPYINEFYQHQAVTSKSTDDLNENDLKSLLKDSNGVQIFTEFLQIEERAAHYLSFWFGCNGFKKTTDQTKIYDIIKVIYRTFIRSESKTAVALQQNTKKNIVDKISTKSGLDRTIFDDAQIEVWNVLLRDLYPRFVKSDYYLRYINNEKIPTTENTDQLFLQDLSKSNSTEMPYVEYVTSSSSMSAIKNSAPSSLLIHSDNSKQQQSTNNNNNNRSSQKCTATNGGGNKERRSIAETDPQSFYLQLCNKLEKLRIMQNCGRSLLNSSRLIDPTDDDPQKILDIHDSYVMKKEPHKLDASLTKKDADLRSLVSQDSGVATNYDQMFQGHPNAGILYTQSFQAATAIGTKSQQQQQQHNLYSPPLSQQQQQSPWLSTHVYHGYQPQTHSQQQQQQQQQQHQQQPHHHQYQHHYRHDHHHHLRSSRRRNRSEDQSICSLEENTSQRIPYAPRKGKSQASDASSIFDSGVSSTYEQISHSWMISSDRVSHWIINQPVVNTPAEPASLGGYTATECPATTGVMRRSSSAQTGTITKENNSNGTTASTTNSEVWIDACYDPINNKKTTTTTHPSNTTHSNSNSPPPNTNTTTNNNNSLIVGYYLCGDPVPYRTQVPRSTTSSFTLAQFKQLLPRRGPYRFFFKRACDEFDGGGAVQEEYTNDDDILPLWEGKIVAKVEKVD